MYSYMLTWSAPGTLICEYYYYTFCCLRSKCTNDDDAHARQASEIYILAWVLYI